MLSDPDRAADKILGVTLPADFGDVSYFQQYGVLPIEVRAGSTTHGARLPRASLGRRTLLRLRPTPHR